MMPEPAESDEPRWVLLLAQAMAHAWQAVADELQDDVDDDLGDELDADA